MSIALQINQLMSCNPGLKSRFSGRLHFPDFTAEDASLMLRQQLQREYGLELGVEADAGLHSLVEKVRSATLIFWWCQPCVMMTLETARAWCSTQAM